MTFLELNPYNQPDIHDRVKITSLLTVETVQVVCLAVSDKTNKRRMEEEKVGDV